MRVQLCVIFCNIIYAFGADNDTKLELVQVLFRHGARTPLVSECQLFPQYNESYEPWGLAQLTKEGMVQAYAVGQMLRERYNTFLTDIYRPHDVYAYASYSDMTIISLQLALAALYTPVGEQKWNDNLNWIPIPIHTNPKFLDIQTRPRDCPKFIEKLTEVMNSGYNKSSQLNTIFQRIRKFYKNLQDYKMLGQLTNILKIRKHLKMPTPQWFTDDLLKTMLEAIDIYSNAMSSTNTLKRLNGGPIVRRFLENIISSNSRIDKRKIYLYSGNYKNMHAYLRAQNITSVFPDFGSAIIIEKYRKYNDQYFIKILYWTKEPKQWRTLKLDDCPEMCPLEMYSEIIKTVLPSDDEMLCLLKNKKPEELNELLDVD